MTKKTALVTGASRGIGAAIARRLVNDGFFVVGTATSAEGAQQIDTTLGEHGLGLQLQLQSADSIAEVLKTIADQAEPPTVLINNAGVTRDNLLLRMSEDEWMDVIETNLNGLYRVTKAVLRGMLKARWGRIVNVGSVVARMGNPGQSNYVASKSAIEGFSRALAFEVASRNITVNTVAPGFIGTDMTSQLTDEQAKKMLERIPLGRMGEVDEVAGAVAYLVSEEAAYVTAQTLHINGGMYAA
ncbi:MAG: 3-oxoacyl-ACP reductase FabG [Pseudomonadales bacterium]|jgi:3-oxoacyl-[acyl-carrier protein] reductase|nr:3-oxoacyl-ACP reductase FabG [Pseudomonadales bacterium]